MNHEPPNPEKQEPESVFLPVSPELLERIQTTQYTVEVERTGIELQPPKLTRLEGAWWWSVPLGKTARASSINDACDFVIAAFRLPMWKKADE